MTLTDYSNMESEINSVPDKKILAPKTEARFRIVKVEEGIVEKEGSDYYGMKFHSITADLPEHDAPMFNIFLWDLDNVWKDENDKKDALRNFRDFARCVGLDFSRPFDWETDLNGKEGWAIMGIKKDKTGEYPDKNQISQYIIPR